VVEQRVAQRRLGCGSEPGAGAEVLGKESPVRERFEVAVPHRAGALDDLVADDEKQVARVGGVPA
jgi:hypothetical protein